METKFIFNSQICTTREQSERLLALGLKKETADMLIMSYSTEHDIIALPWSESGGWTRDNSTPAWSLHRLIEMMPKNIAIDEYTAYPLLIRKRSDGKWCVGYQGCNYCIKDLYDSVIQIYQLLISEGYLDEFCNKG